MCYGFFKMNGVYALILKLSEDSIIEVGALGTVFFLKGYYVYIGSALNGLEKRVNRHLEKKKKLHWHIDYLVQISSVKEIIVAETTYKKECNIARMDNFTHEEMIILGKTIAYIKNRRKLLNQQSFNNC